MQAIYYLSFTAFENITQLAKNRGFIKQNNKNSYGLSEFLDSVSCLKFIDTRPDWAKRQHIAELKREVRPKWSFMGEKKIARFLDIKDETIVNFVQIGIELGIIITRPLTNGGQAKLTDLAITGHVIEAFGIEWITPVSLPLFVPKDKESGRPRKRVLKVAKRQRTKVEDQIPEDHPLLVYIKRSNGRSPRSSPKSRSN